MESKSSKKLSAVFLLLVGSALFLFGYYLGLPKPSIDNKEIAYKEFPPNLSEKLQSKNNKPSTKPSSLDRDVQVNEEDEKSEVKKLAPQESLEQMLLSAQSETNPIKRSAAYARAFENLNRDNIGQALKAFESLPMGFENMQEYKMLLYSWSQFDPLAAIDYCKTRASGIGAGFATSGVLEGWANRDPESARAWVEDPVNAGMAKLYNFGLVKGWANRDLEGATAYVMNLKGGEDVSRLVGILADRHSREGGFGQASSWAEALPDPKLKEGAFVNLSRTFARDRPEEVAEWLETHANEKYSAKAFENLGRRWSETDPESSID